METHQHRKIGCLEEIAYLNGWISKDEVLKVYEVLKKNQYGQYLKDVLDGNYPVSYTHLDVYKRQVLVLQNTENTTDTDYLTYIYAYDGWLCELVIRDDAPFSKAQGERILELDTFRLVNEGNGFLRITVSDSGSSLASCLLHLRSSQEHREKP